MNGKNKEEESENIILGYLTVIKTRQWNNLPVGVVGSSPLLAAITRCRCQVLGLMPALVCVLRLYGRGYGRGMPCTNQV